MRSFIQRKAACQTEQTAFSGRIRKRSRIRHARMNGGDIDDTARARFTHSWQDIARAKPRPFQINRKYRIPLRLGHLRRVEVGGHARIIDEHVDRAVRCENTRHGGLQLMGKRDVASDELRGSSSELRRELAAGSTAALAIPVKKGDMRALCAELLDYGFADALRATGYDGDLVFESSSFHRSLAINVIGRRIMRFQR